MALAKICGLTDARALDAALQGGAAFIGLMFHPASPRRVTFAEAAELAARARGRAHIVAVTADPDDALLDRLAGVVRPDFIQLHGAESPERVREAGGRARARVIKVVAVSGPADFDSVRAFDGVADHLMFDTRAPAGAERPGGHGVAFDWRLLAGRRFAAPWLLAGGLTPDNVAAAVAASGAPIVDVSSGVEDARGLKDAALITRFLAQAKAA